ncbi:class I SAM-dependent methyltransferase [Legionella pneumophila]|uniref:class I SAM-dependent methyltransferase n=1 Tax=Legionella pneumophila TaxID=446 RepID=UPI0038B66CF7
MLVSNEKVIAEEWKKYAGYTVRPLPSTCAYYKDLIQSNSNKDSFLIYGGTPEIRSLFQESNLKVTLTDQSELIIRAMGYLTMGAASIAANEELVVTNWLNLEGIANDSCDFLIGDDAINMVEWTQFDLFLSNANRVLKSNGLFICHLLVKPQECFITNTIDDVRREYKEGVIRTKYDLASRLNFICYDTNSYAMGWQNTIEQLGSYD